jgi:hypothetical protein
MFLTFYCLFLFQIIVFIVVQLLQKFNEAGLVVIKTEDLYNEGRRKWVFGVGLEVGLETMNDEVLALSLFVISALNIIN